MDNMLKHSSNQSINQKKDAINKPIVDINSSCQLFSEIYDTDLYSF